SNKLISMERLRQLDGRVSKDTLDSSKKLIFKERKRLKELDGHAEDILEDQADINPYAKLIVEGHEMITRVNELAPLPLVIISWIKLKKLPDLLTHTLVGFIVSTVLAGVFVWTGKESVVVLVLWLLLGTLITLCLQGLKIMASATIHSLDEIICMMEPPFKDDDGHIHDPVRDLGNWIRHLFRSPWQYFAIIFFLFVIVTKLIVKSGGDITFLSVAESLGVSLVSLFFISPVIWLIFGSIITLNRLSEMRDLDINPLSPIKTMGLEKWISVIGVYNVTCSIVLTFGCSITIMLTVVKGSDNYDWFWFILIMPLLVFYWIYPHMKISRLVKSIKIERMQFLKTRISSIFNDWVKFEEGLIGKKTNAALIRKRIDYMEKMKPQMDNYYEVFSKIDESPHSYIDIYSTLELLKALGIPSLFALAAALLL
ncbi:MAG: hypothetical protein KAR83_08440, partial [Thermodesulfovibrionales bacterium]|nr:hypothetical protein [Thermodesulfovibrionales bacterium]